MNGPAPHFDLAATPIEDGTTLIEASAGTGKTYCLAGLVVRLLVERKVDSIGRILVVTFTNAAADELSGRIREAVRLGFTHVICPPVSMKPPAGCTLATVESLPQAMAMLT